MLQLLVLNRAQGRPRAAAAPPIVVYTAITGGRDRLRDDQETGGSEFRAYVDRRSGSAVWRELPAYDRFLSPRRNARIHKILAHQFVDAGYSLWMDGNVALRVPPMRLVEAWLGDCDIATFRHRTRGCTYEEAAACREKGLDDPAVIEDQMGAYRASGLEPGAGLPETSVILRRHSRRVELFNNCWWSELCRHSVRDQLGFMHAARRSGVSVRFVTPTKFDHPWFDVIARPAGVEGGPLRLP
jgi:hypothetical protein